MVKNEIGLKKSGAIEPVYTVYGKLMKLFDHRDENGKVKPAAQKAKEEIFGSDCIDSAPGKYWELKVVVDSGMPLDQWEQYSEYQKADFLAIKHLSSMVDAINHYYDHQKRKQESSRSE